MITLCYTLALLLMKIRLQAERNAVCDMIHVLLSTMEANSLTQYHFIAKKWRGIVRSSKKLNGCIWET